MNMVRSAYIRQVN